METWAWLLAYVLGFGLLQLALYHHFRRKDATPDGGRRAADHPGHGDRSGTADRAGGGSTEGAPNGDADGPTVYCQQCGARNAHFSTVRYCRECVAPLQ